MNANEPTGKPVRVLVSFVDELFWESLRGVSWCL